MSDWVVKTLKYTLRVILPYLGRNKWVLWIDFKTIVSYSVKQFAGGAYEWDGVDVAKGLPILDAFPYYLRDVIEFMGFLFFADKQQCGISYLSVNC